MGGERIPVLLLTVEEAGELLRIGRTKAYAMAREWRETDGRSGLPVIDLGHVLRVPRPALEEMIGADLSSVVAAGRIEDTVATASPADPPEPRSDPPPDVEHAQSSTTTRPPRRRQNRIADQLDLFKSDPRSG